MPDETRRCPYCGEEILAIAIKCRYCGEFLDKDEPEETLPEETLWEGNPSHLHYLLAYIVGASLILFYGLGIIILIFAFLHRESKEFTITNKRVQSKEGIFGHITREILIKDILVINLKQNILERIFGLGSIEMGSAGTAGIEVKFVGIPETPKIKDMIQEERDQF